MFIRTREGVLGEICHFRLENLILLLFYFIYFLFYFIRPPAFAPVFRYASLPLTWFESELFCCFSFQFSLFILLPRLHPRENSTADLVSMETRLSGRIFCLHHQFSRLPFRRRLYSFFVRDNSCRAVDSFHFVDEPVELFN